MRKPRIYLETSIFNFYVDNDRGFAHTDTVQLFKEIATGTYEAFTSTYVTNELKKAPEIKRNKMMELISEYNITVLASTNEAVVLADMYIAEGIIPQKYLTDGLHIAIATIYDLDVIVSMNFEHIVKRKTKRGTEAINILRGYRSIEICSPMEMCENEST